jgi:hypothetical protein
VPFNITTFTFLHVALSVVGLIAGLVVVGGVMAGRHFSGWAGTFLVTTFLTNLSGFGFPFVKLLPSHVLGILSLILIPVAMFARWWRSTSTPSCWSPSCSTGSRR